jgi:hypothetical protein
MEVKRLKDRETHFKDASDKNLAKYEDIKKKWEKAEDEIKSLKAGGAAGGNQSIEGGGSASNLLKEIGRQSKGPSVGGGAGSNALMALKAKMAGGSIAA